MSHKAIIAFNTGNPTAIVDNGLQDKLSSYDTNVLQTFLVTG